MLFIRPGTWLKGSQKTQLGLKLYFQLPTLFSLKFLLCWSRIRSRILNTSILLMKSDPSLREFLRSWIKLERVIFQPKHQCCSDGFYAARNLANIVHSHNTRDSILLLKLLTKKLLLKASGFQSFHFFHSGDRLVHFVAVSITRAKSI